MWYRTHSKHLWMYIMIGIGKIVNRFIQQVSQWSWRLGWFLSLTEPKESQHFYQLQHSWWYCFRVWVSMCVFVRVVTEKCGTRDTSCRKTTTEAVRKRYRCVVWIIMKTRFEERCCLAILLIQLLWSHCKMVSSCFFFFSFLIV